MTWKSNPTYGPIIDELDKVHQQSMGEVLENLWKYV